jgi:hypothetical protein
MATHGYKLRFRRQGHCDLNSVMKVKTETLYVVKINYAITIKLLNLFAFTQSIFCFPGNFFLVLSGKMIALEELK